MRIVASVFRIALVCALIAVTAWPALAAYDLTLKCWWKFDEGTGTTVLDTSRQGNKGTLTAAGWVKGKTGNALSFDGLTGSLTCPSVAGMPTGGAAFTVAAWVKVPKAQATRAWVLLLGAEGAGAHYWVLGQDNTLQLGVWNGNKVSTPLPVGQWVHIAAVYDEKNLTGYLNGKAFGSTPVTFDLRAPKDAATPNIPLTLAQGHCGEGYFAGMLDDFRLYHRDLSAEEVKNLVQSTSGEIDLFACAGLTETQILPSQPASTEHPYWTRSNSWGADKGFDDGLSTTVDLTNSHCFRSKAAFLTAGATAVPGQETHNDTYPYLAFTGKSIHATSCELTQQSFLINFSNADRARIDTQWALTGSLLMAGRGIEGPGAGNRHTAKCLVIVKDTGGNTLLTLTMFDGTHWGNGAYINVATTGDPVVLAEDAAGPICAAPNVSVFTQSFQPFSLVFKSGQVTLTYGTKTQTLPIDPAANWKSPATIEFKADSQAYGTEIAIGDPIFAPM